MPLTLGARAVTLLALSSGLLSGCVLDSPVGVGVPRLPGSTTTTTTARPATPSTPITGNTQARMAAVAPIATRQAAAQGIPSQLVMAVIAQESAFKADAVSSAGAQGLMQLMPCTVDDINARAPRIHIDNAFDPEQNVAGGCWYLGWVHSQVPTASVASGDDWKFALAGYNAGIGRVQGAIDQTQNGSSDRVSFDDVASLLPTETQRYVPSIVSRWQAYAGGSIASN